MLADYGWTDSVAARLEPLLTDDVVPGRLVRVDRGSCLVATQAGMIDAAAATQFEGDLAVGDWVVVRGSETQGFLLVGYAPRTSAIVRRDPTPSDNRDQLIAANIDTAFILYRLDRKLRPAVLERYVVLVTDSGANPVVVLSKSDTVTPAARDRVVREAMRSLASVPVHAISAAEGVGMEPLTPYLEDSATVALLGESGVGKSTLINSLVGTELLETGETRASDGRGRHTTTARELIPLGNGVVVIDTPGLRSVGLVESGEGLDTVFADIEELARYCKFRDCGHTGEPGCSVETAIDHGVLDRRRLESYLKLRAEQERVAERKAAIERRRGGGRRS